MRHIIARTTTYDGIRDQMTTVTAYEERGHDGAVYYEVTEEWEEIGNEENGSIFTSTHDTMRQALEVVAGLSGYVVPTNGGKPAFEE